MAMYGGGDPLLTELSQLYPKLRLDDATCPARWLLQEVLPLLPTGARKDSLIELCEEAKERPWYFLPTNEESVNWLLDRIITSGYGGEVEVPSGGYGWFNGRKPLLSARPAALVELFVKEFLSKGAIAHYALGISLLQVGARMDGKEEQLIKTFRYNVRYISEIIIFEHISLPIPIFHEGDRQKLTDQFLKCDWIGFDLDFTLIDFVSEQSRIAAIWDCVSHAISSSSTQEGSSLVEKVLVQASHMPLPVDIYWKCVLIDVEKGNFLKLDKEGKVAFAIHGTTIEIDSMVEYENFTWDLKTNANTDRYVLIPTDIEVPLANAFGLCVDLLDEQENRISDDYPAIFKLLTRNFILAQSPYFEHSIGRYYFQDSRRLSKLVAKESSVYNWLSSIKRLYPTKKLFLLSDAKESHLTLLMDHVLGGGWTTMFDLIVADATKSKYFIPSSQEFTMYAGDGKICVGGCIDDFKRFTSAKGVMYFGDHPVKDIILPNSSAAAWKTVAVMRDLTQDAPKRNWMLKTLSQRSNKKLTSNSRSTSAYVSEDGAKTALAVYLDQHATSVVPSIKYCASQEFFVK